LKASIERKDFRFTTAHDRTCAFSSCKIPFLYPSNVTVQGDLTHI
jgi:hypothetical protein